MEKDIEERTTVKQAEPLPPERELKCHNPSETNENDIKEDSFDPDAKKHILIIDDDAQIRRLLATFLKNAGYEVMVASGGNEGLRLFHEKPVDLVITDMVMPGKMGIDVIWELKEKFPEMKVIAISGGGSFGPGLELDLAQELEAYTLCKPFSYEELLKVVNKCISIDQTKNKNSIHHENK